MPQRPASSIPPAPSVAPSTVLQNRAFIELSRVLASGDSAVLSTSLPFVVHGAGLPSGAIYSRTRDDLTFVAAESVPLHLRAYLEEPALVGAPDFLAQRALKQRRTVIDRTIFGAGATPGAMSALHEAGWQQAIAVPILASGKCIGVLLAGARQVGHSQPPPGHSIPPAPTLRVGQSAPPPAPARGSTIDASTALFLEAMANLLGAALGHPPSAPARATTTSSATCIGCIAESADALATLGHELATQQTLLREMGSLPGAPPQADALLSQGRALDRGFRRLSEQLLHMPALGCSHARRPVAMPSVVDIAVHAARPALAVARAELEVVCSPACEIEGFPDLLAIALRHLLCNAAESFAPDTDRASVPSGRRRVRICVRTEGPNVAVHVEDSGPGVPQDLRARVFEPSVSTKGTGRGLGLAVARHVVTAHNGWMELGTSELGGARLSVLIPGRSAALEALRRAPTLPQQHALGNRRSPPPIV